MHTNFLQEDTSKIKKYFVEYYNDKGFEICIEINKVFKMSAKLID